MTTSGILFSLALDNDLWIIYFFLNYYHRLLIFPVRDMQVFFSDMDSF